MISVESLHSYHAARRRAALLPRGGLGRIVVSGQDRASYLQGLLTNDIAALKAGQGCYAAYLTPQGRMITDLWVYELGDVLLLTLPREVKDAVLAKLDQFIFTEDVQLGDVTDTFDHLAIVGPEAAQMLSGVLSVAPELLRLPEHGNLRAELEGHPVIVLAVGDLGEAGYDVLADGPVMDSLRNRLLAAEAAELDAAAAEALRIEAGVPRFHVDMDEDTIPLEAGIETRAISLTKGCYVGQEVIIRVLHRGHGRVARKLVGLTFEAGALPAAGSRLQADGKDVGNVTSCAWSPALGRSIGLGYVHRDFVAPGTDLTAGAITARVAAVPFVPPAGR
ncbi:MAG: aminomethyl transferase family protein [Luteitalea sp.]|nr:aminomethyl transferase family protein [Luteitalea sp.]